MPERPLPIEEYYNIDLQSIISLVKEKSPERVGVQLPEGLKQYALDVMRFIEQETGVPCVLSLAPCYGACDLRGEEFGRLGVGLVLHFGHSEIPELMEAFPSATSPETLFIALPRKIGQPQLRKLAQRIRTLLRKKKESTLILTASVQYVHVLPALRSLLEEEFHVKIPKGDSRMAHPGQVLGCNFSVTRSSHEEGGKKEQTPENREFVFIGDGRFHPLGLSLVTGKEVLAIEPLSLQTTEYDPKEYLRSRYKAISASLHAGRFGILISTKPGQTRVKLALRMKGELEDMKKEAFLFFDNEILPENTRYMKVDALISTLCPRFTLDDGERFLEKSGKPVLTPVDLEIVMDYFRTGDVQSVSQALENYSFDEICGCGDEGA